MSESRACVEVQCTQASHEFLVLVALAAAGAAVAEQDNYVDVGRGKALATAVDADAVRALRGRVSAGGN